MQIIMQVIMKVIMYVFTRGILQIIMDVIMEVILQVTMHSRDKKEVRKNAVFICHYILPAKPWAAHSLRLDKNKTFFLRGGGVG